MLTDQAEAVRIVEDLVDAQDWRADKRTSWLAILRRLIYSMDWSTGLITAVSGLMNVLITRLARATDRRRVLEENLPEYMDARRDEALRELRMLNERVVFTLWSVALAIAFSGYEILLWLLISAFGLVAL